MPHYVSLQKKWTLFRFARKTDGFFVSPPFSSRLSLVLAFVDIASIGTSQSYSLEHQNVTADAFFRRFLLTNSLSFALVDSGTSQVPKLVQVSKTSSWAYSGRFGACFRRRRDENCEFLTDFFDFFFSFPSFLPSSTHHSPLLSYATTSSSSSNRGIEPC